MRKRSEDEPREEWEDDSEDEQGRKGTKPKRV
jgi:hypothetical protein